MVNYSKAFLDQNSKVRIISGPLKGKECIIKRIDKRKKRATIALHFMGKQTLLDIGIEILDAVEVAEPIPELC